MKRTTYKYSVLSMLDTELIQEDVYTQKQNEMRKYLVLKQRPPVVVMAKWDDDIKQEFEEQWKVWERLCAQKK